MSNYFNDDILNEVGLRDLSDPKAMKKNLEKEKYNRLQNTINKSQNPQEKARAASIINTEERLKYEANERQRKARETADMANKQKKAELERQYKSGETRPLTAKQREIANRPENKNRDIEKELNDLKSGAEQGEVMPHTPNQYHANNPAPYFDVQTKHNLKVAGGVAAGAAAAVGIGAIVANILKKRKWKMNGCNNIEDPSKKQQCKSYIMKKNMSDINSQCKYSNNPEKCKRIAMEKIRDI